MVPARGDPLPAPFGPRPASQLLQFALRAELQRQDALDETATYLDELAAEVGEPTTRQRTHADSIARRVRERGLGQGG